MKTKSVHRPSSIVYRMLIAFAFFIVHSSLFIGANAQSIVRQAADSFKIFSYSGNGGELILENSTRSRQGAYLKNKSNGRTEYAYAVDSLWKVDSILYFKRGDGIGSFIIPSARGVSLSVNKIGDSIIISASGSTASFSIKNKVNNGDTSNMLQPYRRSFTGVIYDSANHSLRFIRVSGSDTSITIQGANFVNANLRAVVNRTHSFTDHNLTFDSVGNFRVNAAEIYLNTKDTATVTSDTVNYKPVVLGSNGLIRRSSWTAGGIAGVQGLNVLTSGANHTAIISLSNGLTLSASWKDSAGVASGGTADGNNYPTTLGYATDVLTMSLSGLPSLTATIPLSAKLNWSDTTSMLSTYFRSIDTFNLVSTTRSEHVGGDKLFMGAISFGNTTSPLFLHGIRSIDLATGLVAADVNGQLYKIPFTQYIDSLSFYDSLGHIRTAMNLLANAGLTPGGTAGQFLTKINSTDYNAHWITATSDNIAEGSTNLYYTNSRFDTRFATKTTDNLTEGSTNKYFSNSLARGAVSATGSISYNSATGVFSYTAPTTVSSFTNDAGYISALPIASSTVLGGVKVGSGLSIDGSGVLNANNAIDSIKLRILNGTFGISDMHDSTDVFTSAGVKSFRSAVIQDNDKLDYAHQRQPDGWLAFHTEYTPINELVYMQNFFVSTGSSVGTYMNYYNNYTDSLKNVVGTKYTTPYGTSSVMQYPLHYYTSTSTYDSSKKNSLALSTNLGRGILLQVEPSKGVRLQKDTGLTSQYDITITDSTKGLKLKSPNGTLHTISVDNTPSINLDGSPIGSGGGESTTVSYPLKLTGVNVSADTGRTASSLATAALVKKYGDSILSVIPSVSGYRLLTDTGGTTGTTTREWHKKGIDSFSTVAAATYQPIGSYATTTNLALKVNISDTASMLANYKAAMIANTAGLALKVNISDTAAMLLNYKAAMIANTAAILLKKNISDSVHTVGDNYVRQDRLKMVSDSLGSKAVDTTKINNGLIPRTGNYFAGGDSNTQGFGDPRNYPNKIATSHGRNLQITNLGVGGSRLGYTPYYDTSIFLAKSHFNMLGNLDWNWTGLSTEMNGWNSILNASWDAHKIYTTDTAFWTVIQRAHEAIIARLLIDDYAGITYAGRGHNGAAGGDGLYSWTTTGSDNSTPIPSGQTRNFAPFYTNETTTARWRTLLNSSGQYIQYQLIGKKASSLFYETDSSGAPFKVLVNGVQVAKGNNTYVNKGGNDLGRYPQSIWLEGLPDTATIRIETTGSGNLGFLAFGWVEKNATSRLIDKTILYSTPIGNTVDRNDSIVFKLAKTSEAAVAAYGSNYPVSSVNAYSKWVSSTDSFPPDPAHLRAAGYQHIADGFEQPYKPGGNGLSFYNVNTTGPTFTDAWTTTGSDVYRNSSVMIGAASAPWFLYGFSGGLHIKSAYPAIHFEGGADYQTGVDGGGNFQLSSGSQTNILVANNSGDVTLSNPVTAPDATSDTHLATRGQVKTGTMTLTNKRWTARVGSSTSSATPTINTDNHDKYKLTAQAADITSFTTNLTGTPNDGDVLEIEITGTGSHTITWGSAFVSSTVTLPTTFGTTTLTISLEYKTTSSYGNNKWTCANYW